MLTDLRFALRQLAKTPGFTVIALLTLAIGIGSATVVFSAINAMLYKPLPLLEAAEDRLLYATLKDRKHPDVDLGFSYPDYADLRQRATTLAGIWIHHERTVLISGSEVPERYLGSDITWDAFAHMGVRPIHGRGFTAADAAPDAPPVALLSAALWKKRYGGKTDVIGSTVTMNGHPTQIIGIMPEGWRYPDISDIWTAFKADPTKINSRGGYYFSGRARLKDGVTIEEAQAEVDAIMASVANEHPQTNTGIGLALGPIRAEAIQDWERQTVLLFGAVLFVFLIACLNVTNLLLARAVTRSKELAVRLALGAPRHRLIRQLITENLILGLLGGIGGLVLGLWGNDALASSIPVPIPFWLRFDFDLRVFGFVFGLSLIGALIFGAAPALKASRPDVVNELKEGGRSADTSGPGANQLRNLLVVLELAIALVLLVGAGLMMRSFLELRKLDPGFRAERVFTFRTGVPDGIYGKDKEVPAKFFRDLLARLQTLPGVEAAAATSTLPGVARMDLKVGYAVEGERPPVLGPNAPTTRWRHVTANYFATLQIPLLAGRTFDDTLDRPDTRPVALVDAAFATRHFGNPGAALGRRVLTADHEAQAKRDPGAADSHRQGVEIVGVVGTIRHYLDRDESIPVVYLPQSQVRSNFMSVVVRTAGDPLRVLRENTVRDTVLAVNSAIPIYEAFPLTEVLERSDTMWPRKFFGWLFTIFGCVALFLACIGIYGVMSYTVTQRTQELGVRMALGAHPRSVIKLVVTQGVRLVVLGLCCGIVAAYLLAHLLSGLLYGVSPHDPPTFATVPLLLAAVALFACWLPSRRAVLMEPNAALRS